MDKLLIPNRLDVSPNSTGSNKTFNHWLRTISSLIRKTTTDATSDTDKLDILINHVSPDVYEYIADHVTYASALNRLKELYIKPTNEIFARHTLSTRKQKEEETIDMYIESLLSLAKECDFQAVNAIENRDDYVRDAFITGLRSSSIRQRLLENRTLKLNTAVDQARSLYLAQKNSESYACMESHTRSYDTVAIVNDDQNCVKTSEDEFCDTSAFIKSKATCYYCGYSRHDRKFCPARSAICKKCSGRGHFARACARTSQNSQKSTSASIQSQTKSASPQPHKLMSILSDSRSKRNETPKNTSAYFSPSSGSLDQTSVYILVGENEAIAMMDTGSSGCFISENFVKKNKLKIQPAMGKVQMASSSLNAPVKGQCTVNINLLGEWYTNVKLEILPDLCSEVILGRDFMRQHSSVNFYFGGHKESLQIPSSTSCSVQSALVETPSLFANLSQDCKPITTKSRRFGNQDKQFIQSEIEKMLQEGVIEESTSPWRAQVLITTGERQRKRLVVDYSRTINRFTSLDAYPLPRMDDLAAEISRYKIYSSLDLKSAYHQIPIREEEKLYTAFEANGKLYQFCRVPFGVTNGVACFQRTMDSLIKQHNLQGTHAYVDNIIIVGNTQKEHDENLEKFRKIARVHNLTFNEAKSILSTTSIDFLGYTITHGTIKPDSERLRPLKELPFPKDKAAMRRVIGLFSYYSQWISKFSEKIKPLVNNDSFPINTESKKAFNNIKEEIGNALLHSINDEHPLVVETDASDTAIAATLNQAGRPVAFFSRSLTQAERKHASVEKEAYAIVEAVKKWSHYLSARRFIIVTDQEAVNYMFNSKRPGKIKNNKIQRWRMELGCYEYDIMYRPGRNNISADALSRAYCGAISKASLSDIHVSLCHPGITRLTHFVKIRNLPYSIEEIKKVCAECPVCARWKPRFYSPNTTPLIKATQPMERLNIDFKGPLPSTSKNRYLLVVVDEYSRFPFAFACANMTTDVVIECLFQIFTIFGTPSYIHSDRGTSFVSKDLREYLTSLGIASSRTTPYNPQGNGQCERYNGIIWKHISMALASNNLKESQWESVLPTVLHSIRSLLCTATNATPHERLFSYQRKSLSGHSLPSWLTTPGPVLLRRHVRHSKYEPLVDEVQLLEANPQYAHVQFRDGRESTVSLRDLAPIGNLTLSKKQTSTETLIDSEKPNNPCTEISLANPTSTEEQNTTTELSVPSLSNPNPDTELSVSEPKPTPTVSADLEESSSTPPTPEYPKTLRRSLREHRIPSRYQ